jgi:hypothetical protein
MKQDAQEHGDAHTTHDETSGGGSGIWNSMERLKTYRVWVWVHLLRHHPPLPSVSTAADQDEGAVVSDSRHHSEERLHHHEETCTVYEDERGGRDEGCTAGTTRASRPDWWMVEKREREGEHKQIVGAPPQSSKASRE